MRGHSAGMGMHAVCVGLMCLGRSNLSNVDNAPALVPAKDQSHFAACKTLDQETRKEQEHLYSAVVWSDMGENQKSDLQRRRHGIGCPYWISHSHVRVLEINPDKLHSITHTKKIINWEITRQTPRGL